MKRDAILNEIKNLHESDKSTARKQLTVENGRVEREKTDMLRSIGKQSGESMESVQEKKW